MLNTILLSIALVALAFAAIGVKVILKKNGRFAGTCATNNPMLVNEIGECSVCGSKPDEACKKEEDEA